MDARKARRGWLGGREGRCGVLESTGARVKGWKCEGRIRGAALWGRGCGAGMMRVVVLVMVSHGGAGTRMMRRGSGPEEGGAESGIEMGEGRTNVSSGFDAGFWAVSRGGCCGFLACCGLVAELGWG